MIAYNNDWLRNLQAREAGKECYNNNCINQEEYKNLLELYPVGFYSPNFFMRIGMLLLTLVCTSFLLGLFMMIFASGSENGLAVIVIFTGLVCFGTAEYFIKEKKHYRSGVDDGLIWASGVMITGGILWILSPGTVITSAIFLIIALVYTLRFTDKLMALFAFLSFIAMVFFTCSETGDLMKAIVPFIIMTFSGIIYLFTKRGRNRNHINLYDGCYLVVEVLSLSFFYLAGNYFVVRELSNAMFSLNLQEGEPIPYGYLFKLFTAAIPVIYVAWGIRRKDIVLIRVGLLILAATVLTVKHYNHLLSIEAAMTIAGIILVAIAWFFTRQLKTGKYGFTYAEMPGTSSPFKPLAESLVISESFQATGEIPASHTEFGGGSFGGAGAGDKF